MLGRVCGTVFRVPVVRAYLSQQPSSIVIQDEDRLDGVERRFLKLTRERNS